MLEPIIPGWSFNSVSPPCLTKNSRLNAQLFISLDANTTHAQQYHPARYPYHPSQTPSLPYPLLLTPVGQDDYTTSTQGVNLFAMLKNPMVLMMLASGVMMYGMPKLLVRSPVQLRCLSGYNGADPTSRQALRVIRR